jgi:multidrug resistance efflux pump
MKPLKINTCVSIIASALWLITMPLFGQEPTTTQVPLPSKEQLAVQKAENNVALLEAKIVTYDSTIKVGKTELDIALDSIDTNETHRKEIDKEYSQKRKGVAKQAESNDKTVATAAKAELKTLDAEYRASAKASDTELKALLKKSDNASRKIEKAEATKKTTQAKLKETRKTLHTAQKSLAAKEKSALSSKGKGKK